MKKPLLSLPLLLFAFTLQANTYYSTNNTAPNITTNWHLNRNGSGASPNKFTNGDIFVIQAGHYLTTTANWTISGTNAKLVIETGATLEGDDKITVPDFEIDGTGTYIHNKNTNSFPGTTSRTFASNSIVELRDWSGTAALPSPTTWGNLIINVSSYSSNWNQAGNLTDVAGNLIIRNTGTNEFRLATTQDYTLTIGGDLIIENGVLEAGQNNGNHDQEIIINGSFVQSGGTFTRSNNNANTLKIEFNGASSNFTITGGTLIGSYIDWIINNSKKLVLNSNLSIASSRSLTVNGTIDCGTNQVTGAGSFTLTPSGTVVTSSSSGISGVIALAGTKAFNNGSSFEFHAATTNPFLTSGGTISASNILVDADVTLNKDVSVSGSLNLISGKLIIPAANTLTLASGSIINGSGFNASKHLVTQVNTSTGAKGVLRISNVTGTTTLPVGNDNYYLPVTLTTLSPNDFSISVFQGATTNGSPNGTAVTAEDKKRIVDAVWIINKNSGTGVVTMKLNWPSALEGVAFQGLADNQIGIAHYGGYWESALGSGNQTQNTATRMGIATFSPFNVGQIATILPLKFGDIKVYKLTVNSFSIDWTSYNETRISHFEIERSQNDREFAKIGSVNAISDKDKADYSWIDSSPLKNISYYRINAVDIDGRSNYSAIARIDPGQAGSELTLFPNPVVNRRVSIEVGTVNRGEYKLTISNLYGRIVYNKTLDHPGGIISQVIQLPVDVSSGMYTLSVNGNGVKLFKQFVVR